MLDEQIFDSTIVDSETLQVKGDKPWFIKFFAPWCGHCKNLAPTWDEFHKRHSHEVNIGRIDCTDENSRSVCGQFGVRGYPTLIFLKEGKYYTFRGPRKLENLADFALNEGYLSASEEQQGDIPKRVEGMEKFQKDSVDFFKQLSIGIDQIFEKVHMGFIPKPVRYLMVAFLVLSPFFMVIFMLCFDEDDEPSAAPS